MGVVLAQLPKHFQRMESIIAVWRNGQGMLRELCLLFWMLFAVHLLTFWSHLVGCCIYLLIQLLGQCHRDEFQVRGTGIIIYFVCMRDIRICNGEFRVCERRQNLHTRSECLSLQNIYVFCVPSDSPGYSLGFKFVWENDLNWVEKFIYGCQFSAPG